MTRNDPTDDRCGRSVRRRAGKAVLFRSMERQLDRLELDNPLSLWLVWGRTVRLPPIWACSGCRRRPT